jgi:hypothetical protein
MNIVAELFFQEAVYALDFLLLTELNAVVRVFSATLTVLTGGEVPSLNGAFVRITSIPLEEEFCRFSTAEPAYCF